MTHKSLVGHVRLKPVQSRVRPATYAPEEGGTEPRMIIETRYIDGRQVSTVLLDSIPSQAKRMKGLLYELRAVLGLPDIVVRFPDATYSQWEVPHGPYDAITRDSHINGVPFFATEIGRSLATGDPQTLFSWAPNVLLFGGWNSHAQQDVGHVNAARVERAVTAEIVGLEPRLVARTHSRLDPTGIPGDAPLSPAYEEEKERLGGGRAIKKFSELGLGSVAPGFRFLDVSIVDAQHLILLTTLSWRRMRLPETAQAVLRDLVLLALARLYEDGLYLRSGTILVPEGEPVLTDPVTGDEVVLPSSEVLIGRIREGLKILPAGYSWDGQLIELTPSRALLEAYQGQSELRRRKRRGGEAG